MDCNVPSRNTRINANVDDGGCESPVETRLVNRSQRQLRRQRSSSRSSHGSAGGTPYDTPSTKYPVGQQQYASGTSPSNIDVSGRRYSVNDTNANTPNKIDGQSRRRIQSTPGGRYGQYEQAPEWTLGDELPLALEPTRFNTPTSYYSNNADYSGVSDYSYQRSPAFDMQQGGDKLPVQVTRTGDGKGFIFTISRKYLGDGKYVAFTGGESAGQSPRRYYPLEPEAYGQYNPDPNRRDFVIYETPSPSQQRLQGSGQRSQYSSGNRLQHSGLQDSGQRSQYSGNLQHSGLQDSGQRSQYSGLQDSGKYQNHEQYFHDSGRKVRSSGQKQRSPYRPGQALGAPINFDDSFY